MPALCWHWQDLGALMETKKVQYVLSEGAIRKLKIVAARRSVTQSELLALLIERTWRTELPAMKREAECGLEKGGKLPLVAGLEEK